MSDEFFLVPILLTVRYSRCSIPKTELKNELKGINKNVSLSLEAKKDLASKIMNAKFHNIENHTYRIRHIVRETKFEPQSMLVGHRSILGPKFWISNSDEDNTILTFLEQSMV